jgi:hypothetical protein
MVAAFYKPWSPRFTARDQPATILIACISIDSSKVNRLKSVDLKLFDTWSVVCGLVWSGLVWSALFHSALVSGLWSLVSALCSALGLVSPSPSLSFITVIHRPRSAKAIADAKAAEEKAVADAERRCARTNKQTNERTSKQTKKRTRCLLWVAAQ